VTIGTHERPETVFHKIAVFAVLEGTYKDFLIPEIYGSSS
jgi:hypothetical protein